MRSSAEKIRASGLAARLRRNGRDVSIEKIVDPAALQVGVAVADREQPDSPHATATARDERRGVEFDAVTLGEEYFKRRIDQRLGFRRPHLRWR